METKSQSTDATCSMKSTATQVVNFEVKSTSNTQTDQYSSATFETQTEVSNVAMGSFQTQTIERNSATIYTQTAHIPNSLPMEHIETQTRDIDPDTLKIEDIKSKITGTQITGKPNYQSDQEVAKGSEIVLKGLDIAIDIRNDDKEHFNSDLKYEANESKEILSKKLIYHRKSASAPSKDSTKKIAPNQLIIKSILKHPRLEIRPNTSESDISTISGYANIFSRERLFHVDSNIFKDFNCKPRKNLQTAKNVCFYLKH